MTTLDPHHPQIRLAVGDLTAALPGTSPCGRTGMRIKGWMGRADQTTKVKGMFVRPEQVAEIARRHPELGKLRLVVTREGETDAMTLAAEAGWRDEGLRNRVAETLQAVTKLKGAVDLVAPGSLPNDGKVIADERKLTIPAGADTPASKEGVAPLAIASRSAPRPFRRSHAFARLKGRVPRKSLRRLSGEG